MSGKHPPLTSREVKRGLKILGFEFRTQKGSHEQWIKDKDGKRYKVTVDCPKEPFSADLITSMASQAGVSKKDFYIACRD